MLIKNCTPGTKTKCVVCPHECNLPLGQTGRCRVRTNVDNKISLGKYAGYCSSLVIDTIEKRPFFHFYPSNQCLSVGLLGCSLSCPWCLSREVSQDFRDDGKLNPKQFHTPISLINLAQRRECNGIVFTYNEPLIHYEFLKQIAFESLKSDLYIALKTNGFISKSVVKEFGLLFDAFNVDIKGNDEDYKQIGADSFEHTKETITMLIQTRNWLEINYLVTPRIVDDFSFHREKAEWLAHLRVGMPVHLLYFYPYGRSTEGYGREKLVPIYDIFKSYLSNVYISNVFDPRYIPYRHTKCSKCDKILISRNKGVEIYEIECCGKKIEGIFSKNEYN